MPASIENKKLGSSVYLWTIIGVIFFRHFIRGQSREMRRMQHEKDMEAMRQEGLLRRLSMTQQRQEPSDGGPVSGIINRSPNTRTGEWEYYGPFGYGG